MLIVDCHGHYTTAPEPHQAFRKAQLAHFDDPSLPPPAPARISDDQIRESIEQNQLRLQKERGADLTLFSPRASAMAHHQGDSQVSKTWSRACNDLIRRVVDLYPGNFVGACQLPQSPGVAISDSIHELERCVTELGFVGCNLNPDPSGGHRPRQRAIVEMRELRLPERLVRFGRRRIVAVTVDDQHGGPPRSSP